MWIRRLNDDRLALCGHVLLRRGFKSAGILRALAHNLYRVENSLLVVEIGIAQSRGPREIFVHIGQDRRELCQGLHAGIPGLFIHLAGQLRALETRILLQPSLRFHNLGWVSRSCQNLGHQFVRIQGDGRHQLLQLFRGHLHRLGFGWRSRLNLLILYWPLTRTRLLRV